jgi:hypothetical protein
MTAVIFSIPTPLMIGACDLFYELKEFMPAVRVLRICNYELRRAIFYKVP